MKPFLLLYKPQGMTPLRAIDMFREQSREYADVTLGVAGRLDPMAEGLILVLVGDENKKRKEYEQLSKTYTMDVLFGFSTDTYDELGLVTHASNPNNITETQIQDVLKGIPQTFNQPYPPYSSKPVNGKPLYFWARENKLDSIDIPTKKIHIKARSVQAWKLYSRETVTQHIRTRVFAVSGDFRQESILERWTDILSKTPFNTFPVATITITASSGTYMRGLADMIGQTIGTYAIAYSIIRTHIGNHSLEEALPII